MAADFVGAAAGGVSVLVTRNGETAVAAAGVANADGDPIIPSTLFRVTGITKTFIATMVLQLLDEDLSISMPHCPPIYPTLLSAAMSRSALLSHRSGVPDYTLSRDWQADAPADPSRWFTADEIIAYVEAMGPDGPDQDGYSNTNYVLLGQLVERLDGTDPATSLATRITGPLGLTSTRLATETEPGTDGLAGGWTTGWLDGIPLAGDPDTPYDSIISLEG